MKKLFYLLFAGALLLPFSCNQNDKTKTDEVKMEEPSTKHAATVIHFKDQNPTLSIQGTDAAVTKLEFMEASRFLLRYNAPTKAAEPAALEQAAEAADAPAEAAPAAAAEAPAP